MSTIRIKSNYNQFIKKIRAIPDMIEKTSRGFVEDILKKMCADMKREIEMNRSSWLDGGAMDVWDNSSDIDSDITYMLSESGKSGTISIKPKNNIVLQNGDVVNPYFFIEFGYGIIGESNPAKYAAQNNWVYNVNGHKDFIIYAYDNISGDKETVKTQGTRGINFFYNTVAKYRKNWVKLAEEYFKKAGINGKQ